MFHRALAILYQPTRVGEAAWWIRLAKARQQRTKLAQVLNPADTHPEGHTPGCAKQVGEDSCIEAVRLPEQQCRALSTQRHVSNCRQFKLRRGRFVDAQQFACLFQADQKAAQVSVVHTIVI